MARNYIFEYLSGNPAGKKACDELMFHYSKDFEDVSPQNVYKAGSRHLRELCNITIPPLLLKGSRLLGGEYLKELYELSQAGHSCLLLVEHYSNFDLPMFCYCADKDEQVGMNFADNLIAIAGVKLGMEDQFISAYIQAYNRITIYPSRGLKNTEMSDEQKKLIMDINMASMKELTTRKYNKQIVLAFPSGTRIRPWDAETKKGVKEMASYVKAFEYLCFVSINGNTLPVDQYDSSTILGDKPSPDLMLFTASPIVKSKDFLEEANKSFEEGSDKKAHIVSKVMEKLTELHNEVEPIRQEELMKLKKII